MLLWDVENLSKHKRDLFLNNDLIHELTEPHLFNWHLFLETLEFEGTFTILTINLNNKAPICC